MRRKTYVNVRRFKLFFEIQRLENELAALSITPGFVFFEIKKRILRLMVLYERFNKVRRKLDKHSAWRKERCNK